jgi:hypothetical protein
MGSLARRASARSPRPTLSDETGACRSYLLWPTAEAHLLSAALSDEGFVHILFGRRPTVPKTWAALSVVQLGLSVEDGRDSSFGTPRPTARRRRYDA